MDELILSVSDFVAVFNQTIHYAYPNVVIEGELDNFRVSKQRWVYFSLKDEFATVNFFGSVDQLPGPLENGLILKVKGVPNLHDRYGFSVNVMSIQPTGEGSLKRAAQLLEAKLKAEGLFDPSRKRQIQYPVKSIGLITSSESAAYHDFIKILGERWGGVYIELFDVQVQGDKAPVQIVEAINYFNAQSQPLDVVTVIRGGGSIDDLATFNTEIVTRTIALSRIPTLVAIGHEVDISLAELAADKRGSTPSHAAELLVPDKKHVLETLNSIKLRLSQTITTKIENLKTNIVSEQNDLISGWEVYLSNLKNEVNQKRQLIEILNPLNALKRGYAIIKKKGEIITSVKGLKSSDLIDIYLSDGEVAAMVKSVELK